MWYLVKLAPGTAHPATMTPLPIQSRFGEVIATALSASGQELAVGVVPAGAARRGVEVYSLATGKLLHDWTTNDSTALVPNDLLDTSTQFPALTWIDDDQAIAFSGAGSVDRETVRRLNVVGGAGRRPDSGQPAHLDRAVSGRKPPADVRGSASAGQRGRQDDHLHHVEPPAR